MQTRTSKGTNLEQRKPLLLSIQAEIDERLLQIAALEERLQAFESTPRIHEEELARIRSELSTHRRELRAIEKELARLGVAFDPENPRAIVHPGAKTKTRESSLGDTGFRQPALDRSG